MTQRRIYQSEYPYFVTFRTKDNYPLFDELKYTALMSEVIFNSCNIKYFDVLSYQIMPDHVHLLTQNHKIDRTMLNNSAPAERCARGQSNGFNHIITERVSVPAMGLRARDGSQNRARDGSQNRARDGSQARARVGGHGIYFFVKM